MFSTPQSKAFFSQQVVKGKLIAQQINLINHIHQKVWQCKSMIQEVIKILWNPQNKNEIIQQKLNAVWQGFNSAHEALYQSNEVFAFQVSLRNDIKNLQQLFFKKMMSNYEQKIKQLKHVLLSLQQQVQLLQQKGYLPYVQNPDKNSILVLKVKNYQEYKQKMQRKQSLLKLTKSIHMKQILVSIVDSILHSGQPEKQEQKYNKRVIGQQQGKELIKEVIDKSQQIYSPIQTEIEERPTNKQQQQEIKKQQLTKQKQKITKIPPGSNSINQMLKLLYNWLNIMNTKFRQTNLYYKMSIQKLSCSNKILKEAIRRHKQIMNFQENQSLVRHGCMGLSRQQAIDFLRDMNQDLQIRFSRRNIYMIVSNQSSPKLAQSCINFKTTQQDHGKEGRSPVLRQIDSNLNNSFLHQCSYLISERFEIGQDENQQQIVE